LPACAAVADDTEFLRLTWHIDIATCLPTLELDITTLSLRSQPESYLLSTLLPRVVNTPAREIYTANYRRIAGMDLSEAALFPLVPAATATISYTTPLGPAITKYDLAIAVVLEKELLPDPTYFVYAVWETRPTDSMGVPLDFDVAYPYGIDHQITFYDHIGAIDSYIPPIEYVGVYSSATFESLPSSLCPFGSSTENGPIAMATFQIERRSVDGCRVDFNGDGLVDPDDLSDYVSCFFATPPCPAADYDLDGAVTPDDLSDFITAFSLGC